MYRTDFIETRTDVIKNIYTLYSYTKSDEKERMWALERFLKGKCFIVEPFGNTLMFSPSRFSGYKDNTWQKHCTMQGDGTQTNDNFRNLKLYKDEEDPWLTTKFEEFLDKFNLTRNEPKFFIPANINLNDLDSERHCYFISPTHCNGQKEAAWNRLRDKGIAAIGWEDDDYSDTPIEDIKEIYADQPKAAEAFSLMKQIREGDIICCTNNNRGLWGIGIATSRYKYDRHIHYAGKDEDGNDSFYSHYVEVAWLCFKEQGYILTAELNISPAEKQWQPYGTLTRKEIPDYINNYLLKLNPWDMEKHYKYENYINLLKANKNLILTGAPGTGKTYLAKTIAEEMGAETGFVQFHPSYDYTDFVEGLRPTPPDKNGNIGFERKDGVFKEFCKKALGSAQIIDNSLHTSPKHINNTNTPSDSSKTKTFYQLYEDLKRRIKNREVTLYTKYPKNIMEVRVEDNYILYKKGDRFDSNYINIEYVFKIYHYYKDKHIYDITRCTFNEFCEIIGNTLNYTYYRGIVQELLNMSQNNPTYTKTGELSHNVIYNSTNQSQQPTNHLSCKDTPFVFIIDEINRGEISKIFGELFFSIDPGYRGKKGKVKTQYQNLITDKADQFYDGFYVPENVYIIGTMNDIDRSVESMDFAMRRRFAWQEITASDNTEMLDILGDMKHEVIKKMNDLNNALWDSETGNGIDGLNQAYHIGGAYFCKLTYYLNDDRSNKDEAYRQLWDKHLRGILFEYLRGSVDAMENLKMLENVFFKTEANDMAE